MPTLLKTIRDEAKGSVGFRVLYWCEKLLRLSISRINLRFGLQLTLPHLFNSDYLLRNKNGVWKIKHDSDFTYILKPSYEQELEPYFHVPEGVFIDVGAHAGKWAIFVANRYPRTRVYALEPNSDTFSYLSENVRLNKLENVTAINLAISDKTGPASLRAASDWTGLSKLAESDKEHCQNIMALTLDDFILRYQVRPKEIRLIKIDVEGHEIRVLKGMEALLAGLSDEAKILCEILNPGLAASIRKYLLPLGYSCEATSTRTDYLIGRSCAGISGRRAG